mgnify:FL=1
MEEHSALVVEHRGLDAVIHAKGHSCGNVLLLQVVEAPIVSGLHQEAGDEHLQGFSFTYQFVFAVGEEGVGLLLDGADFNGLSRFHRGKEWHPFQTSARYF